MLAPYGRHIPFLAFCMLFLIDNGLLYVCTHLVLQRAPFFYILTVPHFHFLNVFAYLLFLILNLQLFNIMLQFAFLVDLVAEEFLIPLI